MSVELPEAQILAKQMNKELRGKHVRTTLLQNSQKLQKIGFINKDLSDFARLAEGRINSVVSRGNVIRVKLDNGVNLILAPEYGAKFYTTQKTAHSLRSFTSNLTSLMVRR